MAVSTASAPVFIGSTICMPHKAGQFLGESRQLIVAKGARGQGDTRGLLLEGLHDARMAVPLVQRGVGAEAVQVALAIDAIDPGARGPLDNHVQGQVVVRPPAVFECDEFVGRLLDWDWSWTDMDQWPAR